MPEPRQANREPDENPDEVVDGATNGELDDVEDKADERDPAMPHWADWAPSKAKLALCLGPIILIPLILTPVLRIGFAWLSTNAPLLLITLSNKSVYLALAATQVNAFAYFFIAIARRLIFAPCYYFLGLWGSDKGLAWMAENSPASAKILERIRRWFPRFGPVLVMFYPAHIVRVLAGASKMRFWLFMTYELIGAITVASAVWYTARQFPIQMEAILDFIKRYTWQITAVSFAYVAAFVIYSERKNSKIRAQKAKDLEDLEETIEESIEAEEKR